MLKVLKTSEMKKTTTKTKNSKSVAAEPRLRFFNYWTRSIESFAPTGESVGLYCCGPTVYNTVHIGNLRTFIFEDVLARTLAYFGYPVRQVMNLTDVDDKTIAGAAAAGLQLGDFTQQWIARFYTDRDKLGIAPANVYPRATEHISEMITLIEQLMAKGLAYEADGSVYFAVHKFADYGKLSQIDLAGLKAGARVDVDEYTKEAAQDFVLWKGAHSEDETVGAVWDGPHGLRGRPGWHIECSAMSMKYLGETFDIHSGGIDLLFPHHEDEVAQSVGATGQPFARFFLEAEHLLVDGIKMAKSAKNFYTLAEIEERGFEPAAFRYLVLSAHYRSKLNFTWESLAGASQALAHIRQGFYRPAKRIDQVVVTKIETALADDLDMPKVLALLQTADNPVLWRQFEAVLGLGLAARAEANQVVLEMVKERELARLAKDFVKSDQLRGEIAAQGWEVEDTPGGPRLIPRSS